MTKLLFIKTSLSINKYFLNFYLLSFLYLKWFSFLKNQGPENPRKFCQYFVVELKDLLHITGMTYSHKYVGMT